MSEVLLEEIYKEIIAIRKKLELLEEAIVPTEKISKEELKELKKLRRESLKGEHVRWDDLRKELSK